MSVLPLECVVEKVLVEWLKPDIGQLARHDPEKIRMLAQDIGANGLHQAPGATEDGRLIYGHGRYLGVKLLGRKEIEVKLYPKTLTESQFRIIAITTNIHSESLTPWQKYEQVV